jgi:hypothetical protein
VKKYDGRYVKCVLAQHRLGGDGALTSGVGPVLDANVSTQARTICLRDVAGGEDVRIGRAQMLVDDDSVVDLEAGLCSELGTRGDADANDDHVGVDLGAVTQPDAGRRAMSAGQFDRRGPVAQIHTMAAV